MNQRKAGVILSYFNKLMNMGINLVYVPLLLFYMGTHEYGLYQLMGSVVAYIGLLDFGFSVAVSRFYTEYKALQDQAAHGESSGDIGDSLYGFRFNCFVCRRHSVLFPG